MFWLLAGIALITLVYYYLIKPLQYWKHLHVTQYSIVQIYKNILSRIAPTISIPEEVEIMYNNFPDKRYIGIYQFFTPTLFVRDPELIRQLTIRDFEHFTNHFALFGDEMETIWTRNLFSLRGEEWRNMRNILSPSFTSLKLKTIFPLMIGCAKQLLDHLEKKRENTITLEMKAFFSKYGTDVIATSAFGISCNSFDDPDNLFFRMGNKAVSNNTTFLGGIKFMFMLSLPKIAKILKLEFFNRYLIDYFENIIYESIKSRERNEVVRPDMVQLLVEAKRKTEVLEETEEHDNDEFGIIKGDEKNKVKNIQLTNEDILSQAFLFFLAGYESVAVIMSFLAHALAVNQEVQEKLYQEIQENITNFGFVPSYENLMKMKYLDMVISETLRITPVLPILDRACSKPYTIEPTTEDEKPLRLEVGNLISIPVHGIHRDPTYFPNPDQFDPERFSEENKSNIIPGTYLPFGIGPRHCIGSRFGLMEIKIAFYYILSKFKIVVVDKTQIPLKLTTSQVSMGAENGCWVGLQKRST